MENVYTQHTPPLVSLLEKAARGKLPEQDYPRVDKGGMDGLSGQQAPRVSSPAAARGRGGGGGGADVGSTGADVLART